jgi:putative aldouronate transport system substrate-binding protein
MKLTNCCICLVVALVLSVVLSACGKTSDKPDAATTTTSKSATLQTTTSTSVTTDVPKRDADFDASTMVSVVTEPLPTPPLPLVDEPVTLTVMYPRRPEHGNFDDMWFIKEVEKLTGITLKVIPIETTGWDEKKNLAFASGDYSDIFLLGLSYNEASKYGAAGLLIPLEDLLEEYSPNTMKIFEYLPNARRNVTSLDGHIYLIPAYNTPARDLVSKTGFINETWLKKAGVSMPKTLDDLYTALQAIKDGDGNENGEKDEIPLSYNFKLEANNARTPILTGFGFVNGRHDVIDGKYVYVPMHENFRHYLEYMRRLYEDDLLDHEVFTQSSEQYNAKVSSYRVGLITPEARNYLNIPEQKHAYTLVGPLTSEYNKKLMWPAGANEAIGSGLFCITEKCKNPVAAVKLLDFLFSEEGTFMTKGGPEKGKWDGEGGWTRIVSGDEVSYTIEYPDKYSGFATFRRAHGLMGNVFFYTDAHAKLVLSGDPDSDLISKQIFDSGAYDASREGYPSLIQFTEEEQDILATFVLLDEYANQMTAKFVTGELDINNDAEWDEYIRSIKAMDVETLIEIRQLAYDRWKSN